MTSWAKWNGTGLSPEESERIDPGLLAGRALQGTPAVVFLTGQPVPGKRRGTGLVAAQLNRHSGIVDVDR